MFQLLLAYKKQHGGSTNVPQNLPANHEDKKLAYWIQRQRQQYFKGKLIPERIDLLQSIGFEWRLGRQTSWVEMYNRLVEYQQKYHTTRVPWRFQDDPRLGKWVTTQRQKYWKAKLSQDRVDKLEAIGFEWDPFQGQWMKMFQKLVAYQQKFGNVAVPERWKEDPQLGLWVSKQRRGCKDPYRIDLLNGIGFVWEVKVPKVEDEFPIVSPTAEAYNKLQTQLLWSDFLVPLQQYNPEPVVVSAPPAIAAPTI